MKFCKNCGHELKDNQKVCTQCGTPVEPEQKQPEQKSVEKKPVDPETRKRNKRIGIIVGAAVVLLIVLYMTLSHFASPDRAIDKIVSAVEKSDANQLKSEVSTDMSDEEANAYLDYIEAEVGKDTFINDVKGLKNQIRAYGGDTVFENELELLSVNYAGKKWGLFDNYEFTIPKYKVHLSQDNTDLSNIKEFKYKFDGKEESFDLENTFANLIPGIYEIEGTAILSTNEEANARIIPNFNNYNGESVPAKFTGDFYFIELTLEDLQKTWFLGTEEREAFINAVFKLNKEDVNLKDNENWTLSFGPLAYDKDYEITSTIELHGEKIESKPIKFNVTADNINSGEYDYDEERNIVNFDLEYDEKKVEKAVDDKKKSDEVEQNYERFKEDERGEIEQFIRSFRYALEDMYRKEDYSEVEAFVKKGSDMEKSMKENIDSKAFQNWTSHGGEYSHFEDKGDDKYSIRSKSSIKYDGLDSYQDFTTSYDLIYDKEAGGLKITKYTDIQ